MNNLIRNLDNVINQTNVYFTDSRELKTLLNTYRTLLQRVPSENLTTDHIKKFDIQKESLKSTLQFAEWKIDEKLKLKEYKSADNYAEVTYRITKALQEIKGIMRYQFPSPVSVERVTDTFIIKNGRVVLSQIPDRRYKVEVIHPERLFYEVTNELDLLEDRYNVDYEFGDVYFNEIHEGEKINLVYQSKGGNLKINKEITTVWE